MFSHMFCHPRSSPSVICSESNGSEAPALCRVWPGLGTPCETGRRLLRARSAEGRQLHPDHGHSDRVQSRGLWAGPLQAQSFKPKSPWTKTPPSSIAGDSGLRETSGGPGTAGSSAQEKEIIQAEFKLLTACPLRSTQGSLPTSASVPPSPLEGRPVSPARPRRVRVGGG